MNPALPEWMLGLPAGWVTGAGISRTAQVRVIGNSVQVQVAEVVGRWLAESFGAPLAMRL